jgi:RNA polymerase sigma factor (sigma-70 family)
MPSTAISSREADTRDTRNTRDQLFAIFSPLVLPIVRGLLHKLPRDFEEADLLQIGRLALLDACAGFEAYVRLRVRGAALDACKGPSYRFAQHGRLDAMPEIADCREPDPVEAIDIGRRAQRLDSGIAALPDRQAKVLTMRLAGSPFVDVTRSENVSLRTARRLQDTGVAELRQRLAA